MPYNEFEWNREQIFKDTPHETWVPRKDAEEEIQRERNRNTALGASLRNANSNAEILAARIRVLEGEKRTLESRIVDGARREARQNKEISDLLDTQIPTLNTIQRARYKHGTRFDHALGLKGDESLEVVIPRVIEEFMGSKMRGDGWGVVKEHEEALDRIRARCDKAYAGTGPFSVEKCVDNLATAFEAVKIRLNTVESAVKQAQDATVPPPQLDLKIKWHSPLGLASAAYLFTGV